MAKPKMQLEARFEARPPVEIADVEKLTIVVGEVEVEIAPVFEFPGGAVRGLRVRLDLPSGDSLAAFPRADNVVVLSARRL